MLCFIVSGPRPPCELSIPGKGTSNPCFFINASTTVYVEWIQQYVFSTSSGMSLQNWENNVSLTLSEKCVKHWKVILKNSLNLERKTAHNENSSLWKPTQMEMSVFLIELQLVRTHYWRAFSSSKDENRDFPLESAYIGYKHEMIKFEHWNTLTSYVRSLLDFQRIVE